MKNPYISINKVAELRLIPWAINRHTIKKLIDKGLIQHFVIEGEAPRYKTTKEWVLAYVNHAKKKR